MKRFLTMIAVISVTLVAMAQHPMVSLYHEGEFTFFRDNNAFMSAYEAATNGDIIYLSEGNFEAYYDTEGNAIFTLKIIKRISIVGSGYKSVLSCSGIDIDMSNNPDSYIDLPLFDGVNINASIFFVSNLESKKNLQKVEINNCNIKDICNPYYAGDQFIIDKCKIDRIFFDLQNYVGTTYNNTILYNSKIGNLVGNSYSRLFDGHDFTLMNCNVKFALVVPRLVYNSIIGHSYNSTQGQHFIYNSLLPLTMNDISDITLENCYFIETDQEDSILDENLEASIPLTNYIGNDGTEIGIYGGNNPFTEFPSVPTVDSSNSKVDYNPENNQLNISIKISDN